MAKKEKKQETEDQVTEETVSDTETAAETNENPDAENPAEDKTAEFEAALSAERDKYLRLAAEYDNCLLYTSNVLFVAHFIEDILLSQYP